MINKISKTETRFNKEFIRSHINRPSGFITGMKNDSFAFPFTKNVRLENYTRKVIVFSKTDREKAEAVFDAILGQGKMHEGTEYEIGRLNIKYDKEDSKRPNGTKDALSVFEERGEDGKRFALCIEYAFLYVVMARIAGLRAVAARVFIRNANMSYSGQEEGHICAAVEINNKQILVDPAFFGFDIKHKKFVFLDDTDMLIFYRMTSAGLYFRQDRLDLTVEEFKKIIGIKPGHIYAYINLGIAFTEQDKLFSAVRVLKEAALRIDPDNADAHAALGMAYLKQLRLNLAEEELELAVAIDPGNAVMRANLGTIYGLREKYYLAIKELNTAIGINPIYVKPHYNLAVSYQNIGRNDLAETELNAIRILKETERIWNEFKERESTGGDC